MKVRLPDTLSPRAKQAYLRVPPGESVRVLLNVSASANLTDLQQTLEALGAQVMSVSAETHSLGAAIPSENLLQVASMRDVTYVDAASIYTL